MQSDYTRRGASPGSHSYRRARTLPLPGNGSGRAFLCHRPKKSDFADQDNLGLAPVAAVAVGADVAMRP